MSVGLMIDVKTCLLTILVLFLLMIPVMKVDVAIGQVRIAGVSAGDSFKLNVTFSWNSTNPNMPMPSYYQIINETEWLSYLIVNVSGTNVTAQTTNHLRNGTDLVQTVITDIDTGNGNATYSVVAANLNVNDTIYTSSMYLTRRINETIMKDYSDGARNTNHLNITTEINTTGSYQYASQNVYWDKQTGFMVENTIAQISETNVSRETMFGVVAIAESNVWVVPEFPALTPVLVAFILLTAALVFYKRRLRPIVIDRSFCNRKSETMDFAYIPPNYR